MRNDERFAFGLQASAVSVLAEVEYEITKRPRIAVDSDKVFTGVVPRTVRFKNDCFAGFADNGTVVHFKAKVVGLIFAGRNDCHRIGRVRCFL